MRRPYRGAVFLEFQLCGSRGRCSAAVVVVAVAVVAATAVVVVVVVVG